MNRLSKQNRLVDSALICVFLVTLFVPLLTWVSQPDAPYSDVEKRELQAFPSLAEKKTVVGFTRAFDQYYQDHFGMREWLIGRYHREINKRFGLSGVSDVHEGREGWLFFSHNNLLDDLEGRLRFSQKEEELFWDIFSEKKAWLQERGIAYMFLVAPNKQSIYPEYVFLHSMMPSGKSSRLDHLLASTSVHGGEAFIDVRPRLRQEKNKVRLYDKSDTHWNYMGAHVAYQVLIERVQLVFPTYRVRKDFRFSSKWKEGVGGDLAVMLGRQEAIVEARPVVKGRFATVPKRLGQQLSDFLVLPQLKPFYSVKKNGQLKVLVLHDSFFNVLKPFVGDSFGEVLYVTQYYDAITRKFLGRDNLAVLLDMYQPDLVIEELVERNLPHFLLTKYQD